VKEKDPGSAEVLERTEEKQSEWNKIDKKKRAEAIRRI